MNTAIPTTDGLFLDSLAGVDTDRAPVWIMRQAGRFLPEYRALKERYSFWELCMTPELACQVTLLPLQRFDLDAAILFQDIMTPLPAMGVGIEFAPGPVIEAPVRNQADVDALRIPAPEEIAPYVTEAIRLIRRASRVPLIGFGGAPLTLATYLVEGSGSKDYALFRQFLRREPRAAHALLGKLTEVTISYLRAQVDAGAQAVQLFDSWVGLHDEATYLEFGRPYVQRVFEALSGSGAPRIYLAFNSLHLYPSMASLPIEAVSVDWRQPLSRVREFFPRRTLQGNLDPAELLAPAERLRTMAQRVLVSGLGGGHVFNLGHGIMPQTDPGAVALLVDVVRSFDRAAAEGGSP